MTYKGKEIGTPTLEMVQNHINRKNMAADPKYVYDYYTLHKWKNKHGKPIKSLEIAIGALNACFLSPNPPQRIPPINEKKRYLRYDEQLKDKRWNAFRKFIFAVRGNKCERCGVSEHLQIHHTEYIKGRNAWEYTCNEVVVLCGKCHQKEHGLVCNHQRNQHL